jgi:hypothetical protein
MNKHPKSRTPGLMGAALLCVALSATISCGRKAMEYRGTVVSTKLGYALQAGDGLYYLEGSQNVERMEGKRVTVTGALSQRNDLPAFVMTKGMKEGKEPIPQGIPVDSENQLARQRTRHVITVQTVRTVE